MPVCVTDDYRRLPGIDDEVGRGDAESAVANTWIIGEAELDFREADFRQSDLAPDR